MPVINTFTRPGVHQVPDLQLHSGQTDSPPDCQEKVPGWEEEKARPDQQLSPELSDQEDRGEDGGGDGGPQAEADE